MVPRTYESVEKVGFGNRFCLPRLSPSVLLSISGKNTGDDGSAVTDRVVVLLVPFGRLDSCRSSVKAD